MPNLSRGEVLSGRKIDILLDKSPGSWDKSLVFQRRVRRTGRGCGATGARVESGENKALAFSFILLPAFSSREDMTRGHKATPR
jgi:hypothetical protein